MLGPKIITINLDDHCKLHNFEDNEKSFPKGTVLETGGLKYSLDQEVKVASASVITIEGGLVKQPGKVKASSVSWW